MTSDHHPSDFEHTRYLSSTALRGPAAPDAPAKRYGVAVIGLGRAGSIHLANILQTPRLQIRYIVDGNTERLKQVKYTYCLGEEICLLDAKDSNTVMEDSAVSAVLIATPSGLHEPLVLAALSAGKHVFCEKPIALHLEQVQRCYALAKKTERILLCAFNRRYDPAFASVVEGVRAGKVGTVQCVSTVSRDSPRPTIEYLAGSGGIFHDCIVHDVDLICHTVGEYPSKVVAAAHAFSADIAALDDHDTVVVTMKFPSGVIAHIDISRHAVYGYDQRLEVHGSGGMLRSENQRPHEFVASTPSGCTSVPIKHSFPSRYSEAYKRQTDHFLALLDGTEEQMVTEESVINVSKIIHALEKSVKTETFESVEY